jgi:hypothetical protein
VSAWQALSAHWSYQERTWLSPQPRDGSCFHRPLHHSSLNNWRGPTTWLTWRRLNPLVFDCLQFSWLLSHRRTCPRMQKGKTYDTEDSLVVTHPNTMTGLSMGEQTRSWILQYLWSYVVVCFLCGIIYHFATTWNIYDIEVWVSRCSFPSVMEGRRGSPPRFLDGTLRYRRTRIFSKNTASPSSAESCL